MERPQNGDLNDIVGLARRARWWIVLSGNALALSIGVRILIDVLTGVGAPEPGLIRAVALVLYLFSWILGTNFDATVQRRVYSTSNAPKGTRSSFHVVAGLIAIGAVLVVTTKSDENCAIALTTLYILNVIAWIRFVSTVNPIISGSATTYRDLHPERLALLHTLARYLTGNWQLYRFAVML